ncbi:4Fe-4S dicluster domain-containing protein [Mailhella sp.]|uniref:4Fe-4S dicluster domain-containing protein n=1 Tax=Mailhella sp. TaxID=1981029 RepID=UPI003AB71074
MPPIIDKDKCIGCGICAAICTMDVFSHSGKGHSPEVLYPEECWHCRACTMDCPKGAVRLRLPIPYRLLFVDSATLRQGRRV